MTVQTSTPQEIVAAPYTLYVAPIGTAVPAIDLAPSLFDPAWQVLGKNGDLDYDSSGITFTHNETLATWTSVGSTGASKVWRTDEQLEVAVTLADTSTDTYALVLNDAAVTTVVATTGHAGSKSFPLLQGPNVSIFALLARGVSAENNALNSQYSIPAVYQAANPAPVGKKGAPMELACTFATLIDPNGGGFGTLIEQTTVHL